MMWLIPAGMAAAGAYKGSQDRAQEGRDRLAESEIARWSPWTGMAPQRVKGGSGAIGGAMQGGIAGAGLMQNMKAAGYGDSVQPATTAPEVAPPSGETQMSMEPPQGQSRMLAQTNMRGQQDPYNQYGNQSLWPIMARGY